MMLSTLYQKVSLYYNNNLKFKKMKCTIENIHNVERSGNRAGASVEGFIPFDRMHLIPSHIDHWIRHYEGVKTVQYKNGIFISAWQKLYVLSVISTMLRQVNTLLNLRLKPRSIDLFGISLLKWQSISKV